MPYEFFGALDWSAPTADQVETLYGTKYVRITLNQSEPERDIVRILSPWLINASIVPTMRATLTARTTTMRERATV